MCYWGTTVYTCGHSSQNPQTLLEEANLCAVAKARDPPRSCTWEEGDGYPEEHWNVCPTCERDGDTVPMLLTDPSFGILWPRTQPYSSRIGQGNTTALHIDTRQTYSGNPERIDSVLQPSPQTLDHPLYPVREPSDQPDNQQTGVEMPVELGISDSVQVQSPENAPIRMTYQQVEDMIDAQRPWKISTIESVDAAAKRRSHCEKQGDRLKQTMQQASLGRNQIAPDWDRDLANISSFLSKV
jgi:hypothetical protein